MAITAQEHVDLRLTDLSVQVDSLRNQLAQMQHILTEVGEGDQEEELLFAGAGQAARGTGRQAWW